VKGLEVYQPLAAAPGGEDFSERVSLTFAIGTYLAVNAVRDAYLLMDAPGCAHLKTQFVQGNHDWCSDLTSTSGFHRVANTDVHPWRMAGSREAQIGALLERVARHPPAGVTLLSSLPMATITGLDYDLVARQVASRTGRPVIDVPADGLGGDWLDGYAAVLKALARGLPLDGADRRPGTVGVVGYLMDRGEGDHLANLAALRRVVEGLGLSLASVWPSGGTVEALLAIRHADVVLSLPYGREAARIVAGRTGATLVETGLPLGLAATERWIRQVAAAAGVAGRADAVIDLELAGPVRAVEWVVPYHLLHRRLVFVGEPHLGLAVGQFAEELGVAVEHYVVTNRRQHARALLERAGAAHVTCDPKRQALRALLRPLLAGGRCDLLVTNSTGLEPGPSPAATVELGYPSFYTHALDERPFLFGRGAAGLVERFMNELRRAELANAR